MNVLMVSKGATEENERLTQEQDFAFPIMQWDDEVARQYAVPGTPFLYLIEKGVIANAGSANSLEELESFVYR